MKRVNRLLVLSIVMVMSLSACSSKESQVQDEQPAETEVVVTEEPNKVDEVETPSEEETKEVSDFMPLSPLPVLEQETSPQDFSMYGLVESMAIAERIIPIKNTNSFIQFAFIKEFLT